LLRPKESLWQKVKNVRIPFIPHGWFYQNLVTIAVLNQKATDGWNLVQNIVLPREMNDLLREQKAIERHYGPYTFFAAIAVPHYAIASQTLAYNQTLVNDAQIACALERYWLAHGEYPETPGALAPRFIEKLPHDIIGGQPLHYHRTDDGRFVLYSVGWNEVDDGGKVVLKEDGSMDRDKGDWVWQYPVK